MSSALHPLEKWEHRFQLGFLGTPCKSRALLGVSRVRCKASLAQRIKYYNNTYASYSSLINVKIDKKSSLVHFWKHFFRVLITVNYDFWSRCDTDFTIYRYIFVKCFNVMLLYINQIIYFIKCLSKLQYFKR